MIFVIEDYNANGIAHSFHQTQVAGDTGCCFILITPDWKLNIDNFFDDPTHVRPYTKESLEFLLDSHGFKNIKIVPWLVCKPTWLWKIPFSFLIARLLPFTGSRNPLIPNFLKGKSKTLLVVCTK